MKFHPAVAVAATLVGLFSGSACSLHGHRPAQSTGSSTQDASTDTSSESPSDAAPAASAPVTAPTLDPQTDEGAGKGVDVANAKVAASPKNGSPYLGPKDAVIVVNVHGKYARPVFSAL